MFLAWGPCRYEESQPIPNNADNFYQCRRLEDSQRKARYKGNNILNIRPSGQSQFSPLNPATDFLLLAHESAGIYANNMEIYIYSDCQNHEKDFWGKCTGYS